jgi:hypothetical protein
MIGALKQLDALSVGRGFRGQEWPHLRPVLKFAWQKIDAGFQPKSIVTNLDDMAGVQD